MDYRGQDGMARILLIGLMVMAPALSGPAGLRAQGLPAVVANGGDAMNADDTAARLLGTWAVTEVRSGTIPDDTVPTLMFEAGRLAGFAGCNNFGASLEVGEGGALKLGPAAITRRACPAPQMDVEVAVLRALQRINAVAFEGDGQIVLSAFGTVMLRATRAEGG
jgi:heat shock protein HslJ